MRTLRFTEDVTAPGRFFPRGAVVQAVPAGELTLVRPDPDAHATLCPVPTRSVQPVRRFRVWLLNRTVGLVAAQERCAVDITELEAWLALARPDCELLDVEDLDDAA